MRNVKLISSLLSVIFLSSCVATKPSIKGTYNFENSTTTNTPYEKVWENVIDFFAMNSIPIGVISKESGLITANNISIPDNLVSVEDKSGKNGKPNAWFVIPYEKKIVKGEVSCSFNVRVKKVSNEKTYVEVNLSNIVGYPYYSYLNTLTFQKDVIKGREPIDARSTGFFEKALLNIFK